MLLLLTLIVLSSPGVRRWAETRDLGNRVSVLDIELGAEFPLPPEDFRGRAIDTADALIVFGGNCSGCRKDAVRPESIDTARYGQVILLFDTVEAQVPPDVRAMGGKFRLVCDPTGTWIRSFDSLRVPRFFLIRGGRVAAMDRIGEPSTFVYLKGTGAD